MRSWRDALDAEETGKRDTGRQREQQSGPQRKEWKERMIMNLEGNGSSWSAQIHTAKTGKELERPFGN